MNETKKTGIFWGVALAVALIAAVVVWPRQSGDESTQMDQWIGKPLFAEFKDPLTAASLKIVTFDEEQGELRNFEVRKDPETGLWTIPSKGGYPADAVEQMRDAANALVDLDVLDVPTDNPEDHAGMGVVEPQLDDLDVGDEGVGRLVTFKDNSQDVLASVIVGKPVKGQEGQVYVRKPGQDPVYVVALDDQPLTTQFAEWIEEDLLQLSSIDVENVELKDYNASLGLQGVSLTRNYDVELEKEDTTWDLVALKEYDKSNPLAEPTAVEVEPSKQLNTQKLNDLANALDDLQFVDVKRKPDGISANLKADKDFASDQEAASQLAARGFIPVPMGENGEVEILSANGELTATTKDGVKYILRFGNISGISEEDGSDAVSGEEGEQEDVSGGVNRYLMVSTVVDESQFPVPELEPIPQTLEDLEKLDAAEQQEGQQTQSPQSPATDEASADPDDETDEQAANEQAANEQAADEQAGDEGGSQPSADDAAMSEEGNDASGSQAEDDSSAEESEPVTEVKADEDEAQPVADEKGGGEADATDAAAGDSSEQKAGQSDSGDEPAEGSADGDSAAIDRRSARQLTFVSADAQADEEGSQGGADSGAAADEPADGAETAASDAAPAADQEVAETKEEKLERLAAIQEKITKENERKLEARKEKLDDARLQSKALNERFADWYYVIPESTYSKLRISRDALFQSEQEAAAGGANPAASGPGFPGGQGLPNFSIPGAPTN